MSVVVTTEISVERTPSAASSDGKEWKTFGLYLGHFEHYYQEALVDVFKLTTRTKKMKNVPLPSISNDTQRAKDELQKDPFNMRLINNLGYLYWRQGQHEQCLNVMMRGWKRAQEIPEASVRFRFLMKLAELSAGFWKHRQASAIFRDIEEPAAPTELKAYLMFGAQLCCSTGNQQQGLEFFSRCVEGEPFQHAVRVFAALAWELKKVGGYQVAFGMMEERRPQGGWSSELQTLDSLVQAASRMQDVAQVQLRRRCWQTCVGGFVVMLLCLLYFLERENVVSIGARESQAR